MPHGRTTESTNLKRVSHRPHSLIVNTNQDYRFENLLMRFEEPNSMVRWDSPLFTVLWEEEDVPADEIWKAVTAGDVKAPHAGTQVVRRMPVSSLLREI